MSTMIKLEKEFVRINPKDCHYLEWSYDGKTWHHRYQNSHICFFELMDAGKDVIANTDNGTYWSPKSTKLISWLKTP